MPVTGAAQVLYQYATGYAASFGMDKIQLFSYVSTTDVVKNAVSRTPFDDAYNQSTVAQYSGYLVDSTIGTGTFDLFLNGIALGGSNWTLGTGYITVGNAVPSDTLFFDAKNGSKREIAITGIPTTVALAYSGQELYLNGVNLISGSEFTAAGGNVSLISHTGVNGTLSEYPVVLSSQTGRYTLWTGARYWRDTSNVYLNGVRQEERALYTEGAIFDRLSGNLFNLATCTTLYANTDLVWD